LQVALQTELLGRRTQPGTISSNATNSLGHACVRRQNPININH